jgi:hypothetical protein
MQGPFYNKALKFSCNLFHAVWCSVSCLPSRSHDWLRTSGSCHCPASRERIMLPMANPGKGSSSKFEAWFLLNAYCFHPNVKLKSHTSNHCKSGISRIVFPERVVVNWEGSSIFQPCNRKPVANNLEAMAEFSIWGKLEKLRPKNWHREIGESRSYRKKAEALRGQSESGSCH